MSKKENKHTLLKTIGFTAAAGAVAYGGIGYAAFRKFFDLTKSDVFSMDNLLMHRNPEINAWLEHCERKDTFIDSYDGLHLHGCMFTNHPEAHKWLIVAPEASYNWQSLVDLIYEADHRDFNILAIDQRSCGMSEGIYTTLGWCEHYDLISWVNFLVREDPQAQIVLFGQGVGGMSVMNAAGDFMPKNVKCAIEEGGATGIHELVLHGFRKFMKIDGKAFMPSVDFYVRQILHFSMKDVSTKHQLTNCRIPMMFIHGSEDALIPTSMVFDNFYSCAGVKEIMICEGADHFTCDRSSDYYTRVFDFVDTYVR